MLFEEQLTALGGQNLINFLLRDDIPCPEILEEENCPPEDCSVSEAVHLDEEMDDLIFSMLNPSGDELEALQEYLLAESDSSISEHQRLCYSPGSNFDGSCQSSEIVHIDHNYFCPMLESRISDLSEGDPSPELGTRMDLEGTSMAAKHSSSFPIPDAMNAGPQLVPGSVAQAEEHLQKNMHQKHSAQGSHGSDISVDCVANKSKNNRSKVAVLLLESCYFGQNVRLTLWDSSSPQVATCTTQNYNLGKKVQLLSCWTWQEMWSLSEQLQEPQASGTQSTTETTAKASSMVLVLSLNLIVTSSLLSIQSEETQTEVTVLSQQISEFPDNVVVDVQEDTALELCFSDSEHPLMSISVTQSLDQGQTPTQQHCANEVLPLQSPASCGDTLTPCQAGTNRAVLTDN